MNLYLISQSKENVEYDTFDAAVVCAPDEASARNMNPGSGEQYTPEYWTKALYRSWGPALEQVTVKFLGKASKEVAQGVVCASFRAG